MKVLFAFIVNALFNFVIGLIVAKFLGPQEYGRYSLALAFGLATQAALFDWLRLSTARFYSQRARQNAPDIRATLDASFALIALGLGVIGAAALFASPSFSMSHALIGLALAASIANGLFDFSAALARAAFNDRAYNGLVIVKNLLSLTLTTAAAVIFQSAVMALFGAIVSMLGSIVLARGALWDQISVREANWPRARAFLAYSAPIVAANLLYMLIPLTNRTIVVQEYGYGETGQFSLAFDIGLRALQAVGSALDVLLFQIAVAAHEAQGQEKARAQIARNLVIVLAVILPAGLGVHMIMPSLEALIVPEQFRGPFGHYLDLMLPGLMAMVLILFAVNPIFQIEGKTTPMIAAALVGAVGTPLFWLVLPRSSDASSLALAQSCAYGAALAILCAFAHVNRPKWPNWRDFAAIGVAVAGMWGAISVIGEGASATILILQIVTGVTVYGCLALALDIAQLRAPTIALLTRLLKKN